MKTEQDEIVLDASESPAKGNHHPGSLQAPLTCKGHRWMVDAELAEITSPETYSAIRPYRVSHSQTHNTASYSAIGDYQDMNTDGISLDESFMNWPSQKL